MLPEKTINSIREDEGKAVTEFNSNQEKTQLNTQSLLVGSLLILTLVLLPKSHSGSFGIEYPPNQPFLGWLWLKPKSLHFMKLPRNEVNQLKIN